MNITSEQRRDLRAKAHSLNPVVMIGAEGLSESVLAEIDRTLNAHELIKIRVLGDDREARTQMLDTICSTLNAAKVQTIGKLLVIWRPKADTPKPSNETPASRKENRSDIWKPKKSFQDY